MPEIGDLRKNQSNKEIWTACACCHSERWARLDVKTGKARAAMCLPCGALWAKFNYGLKGEYGNLLVVGFSHVENHHSIFLCICKICEQYFGATGYEVEIGRVASCGSCLRKRGPRRVPTCHPERKYKARGLCASCYEQLCKTISDKLEYNRNHPEEVRATKATYMKDYRERDRKTPTIKGQMRGKITIQSTEPLFVYIFKDITGTVIYVGKTNNGRGGNIYRNRYHGHTRAAWWHEVVEIEEYGSASFGENHLKEAQLIYKYQPKYNTDGVTR